MILTFCSEPSRRSHATVLALASACPRGPGTARAGRGTVRRRGWSTWACSGAPSVYAGAGTVSMIVSNSGSRSAPSGIVAVGRLGQRCAPGLARDAYTTGKSSESWRARRRAGRGTARTSRRRPRSIRASGPVDLVDHEDDRQLARERLAQHEPGLRQRPLGGVDEQDDAVDHRQPALDLAAEVGVSGGVDDVDRHGPLRRRRPGVADRGVLGQDRDALLPLQVAGVHRPARRCAAPAPKAPDCHSIASTSVVLPWSTCATIATLRRSSRVVRAGALAAGDAGCLVDMAEQDPVGWGTPRAWRRRRVYRRRPCRAESRGVFGGAGLALAQFARSGSNVARATQRSDRSGGSGLAGERGRAGDGAASDSRRLWKCGRLDGCCALVEVRDR